MSWRRRSIGSRRASGPLVVLNCAGLAETLIETELFGHEKGAFTGAARAKVGLLEAGNGGTVFLDEVGEMPLSLQPRLLRAIEAREVLPVGAVKPRPIDVRFIAATNRDLEAEVAQGTFRRDLFFRLNGIALAIPPLRERKDEIAALAETFVADACRESGRERPPTISAEAMGYILDYDWPGNIRELKNVIERALVLCDGDEITSQFLPLDKMSDISPASLRLEESGAGQSRAAGSEKRRPGRGSRRTSCRCSMIPRRQPSDKASWTRSRRTPATRPEPPPPWACRAGRSSPSWTPTAFPARKNTGRAPLALTRTLTRRSPRSRPGGSRLGAREATV